jgi:hypothetical protein
MSTDDQTSLRINKSYDGPHYRQEMKNHSHITSYTPLTLREEETKPEILRLFHAMK